MTSGRIEACLAGLLAAASAGAADLDLLLRALARQPPQRIEFVELRRSALLTRDVVVSGTLEYRGREQLSRIVSEPYRERIDIDGSDVRIAREGRPERRFSLRRSAELGGLLTTFQALLSGDSDALEAGFESRVDYLPDGWRLELVPRQPDRPERIDRIQVRGNEDAPTCIAVRTRESDSVSVILLGAVAARAAGRPPTDCDGPLP